MHLLAIQPIWLHNFDAIYCIAWLSWLPTWKLIGFHLIWFSLAYSCWLIIKCPIDNRVTFCKPTKINFNAIHAQFQLKVLKTMKWRNGHPRLQPPFALFSTDHALHLPFHYKAAAIKPCTGLVLHCPLIAPCLSYHISHSARVHSKKFLAWLPHFYFSFSPLWSFYCLLYVCLSLPPSLSLCEFVRVCFVLPSYAFRHCIYIFVSTLKIPARLHGWYRCQSPFKAINDSSQWRYCTWSAESSVAGFTIAFGSHKNGFNTCEQIISYGIYESAQLNNGFRGIFKLNASYRSFCFIEHNQVSAGYKVNNSCTKSSLQSYAYQILYALAESPLSIQFPGQSIAISVSWPDLAIRIRPDEFGQVGWLGNRSAMHLLSLPCALLGPELI